MASRRDWKLKANTGGGQTGGFLDKCEIRENADGSYDLIAVLATHPPHEAPFNFPPFAYRGFVWHVGIGEFAVPDRNELEGTWRNNAGPRTEGEEDGTYTGQAGPGSGADDCEEDAASASA